MFPKRISRHDARNHSIRWQMGKELSSLHVVKSKNDRLMWTAYFA